MDESRAAAEIRAAIEQRIAATRGRDAEAIAAGLSADAVSFEMMPPLSLPSGAAADVERTRAWLAGWTGPIEVDLRDLAVHASGEVGFAHSLNRLSGTMQGGRAVSLWMRSTLGFRKLGGAWKIVHAHTSVPFRPEAGYPAALDLQPD